jgi:hypothetical protein
MRARATPERLELPADASWQRGPLIGARSVREAGRFVEIAAGDTVAGAIDSSLSETLPAAVTEQRADVVAVPAPSAMHADQSAARQPASAGRGARVPPPGATQLEPRVPRPIATRPYRQPNEWRPRSEPQRGGLGVPTNAEPKQQASTVSSDERAADEEVVLLTRAQYALASNPERALALLEFHRRSHPRGAFAEEREALRLEVLHRLGRVAELRQGAREFFRHYPASPQRARIEQQLSSLRASP